MTAQKLEFPLVGAGGERVDLLRTLVSHGVAELPPSRIDERACTLEITLPVPGGRPRTVRVGKSRPGHATLEALGRPVGQRGLQSLSASVRHVLGLDEDLSEFYALAASDHELAWASDGAGRMLRCPTVFEALVKTICTTNCAWSATVRMVNALVEHLGEPTPNAPAHGPLGRAFPTPAAMAAADEGFYGDVVRAGYRGQYLRALAESVNGGSIEVESLDHAGRDELPDEEVAARLLALPGIGPYGAAHVMMLLGRHSRLILDSWSRPKYLRLTGMRRAKDSTIERRFRRYGPYAGLAFWLYLIRDWV
jgi:3-methyladenine DNA glycosylase/8-oxoguanine DNA glycosylase